MTQGIGNVVDRPLMRIRLDQRKRNFGEMRVVFELVVGSESLGEVSANIFGWHKGPFEEWMILDRDRFEDEISMIFGGRLQAMRERAEPLWVKLDYPISLLVHVPWERLLQQSFGVQALRMPYFDLQPLSSPYRLEVALCVSWPEVVSDSMLQDLTARFAQTILSRVRREVMVHVFVDSRIYQAIQQSDEDRSAWADASGIRLYNPDSWASSDGLDQQAPHEWPAYLESTRLRWMASALRGRSVDAVHFLTPTADLLGQGVLLLEEGVGTGSQQLEGERAGRSQMVGPDEIAAFDTHVGAWSLGLSSLPRW